MLWEGTATTTDIVGLRSEPYAFRVCAYDRVGNRSRGATASAEGGGESDAPVATGFALDGGADSTALREVPFSVDVADASALDRWCTSDEASDAAACSPWMQMEAEQVHSFSSSDEGEWTVRYWVRDVHGNVSSPAADAIVRDRTGPDNGEVMATAVSGGVTLQWSGFADEVSEITHYNVVYDVDRAPRDCESGTVVGAVSGSGTTITGLASDTRYGFWVCAVEAAGNASSGATVRETVLAEYDAPDVTSVQNNGGAAVTYARQVTLSVDATDATGIDRMCISTTSSCSTWLGFDAEREYVLPATVGVHTVTIWLRDTIGNETAGHSASIEYIEAVDNDGDGPTNETDCDDDDATVHPDVIDTCDGIDNDCSGDEPAVCDCDDDRPEVNPNTDCRQAYFESCDDVLDAWPDMNDGVYELNPGGSGVVTTECDMTTDGGGWTLITDWDAALGDEQSDFEDIFSVSANTMRTWKMVGGRLRWCAGGGGDNSFNYAGLDAEQAVAVPNGGELRWNLAGHFNSIEHSAFWLSAETATTSEEVYCWDAITAYLVGFAKYSADGQARLPDYTCSDVMTSNYVRRPDLNDQLTTTTGGEVTALRWTSLHADIRCADNSNLSDVMVWIR